MPSCASIATALASPSANPDRVTGWTASRVSASNAMSSTSTVKECQPTGSYFETTVSE